MFEFPTRLEENMHLRALLSHYAHLGSEDRTIWQDRLMQMDELDRAQLIVLHGELIACDWIEQNTGRAILRPDGTLAACYRITPHGLREYGRVQGIENVEEQSDSTEKPLSLKTPRMKKGKNQPDAAVASE